MGYCNAEDRDLERCPYLQSLKSRFYREIGGKNGLYSTNGFIY